MGFRQRLSGVSLTLSLGMTAVSAHAGTFDEADRLFQGRDGGIANVNAARAEYNRLLPSLGGEELAYAIQQLGRLAIFEGLYLLPDDNSNRGRKTALFDDCRQLTTRLAGMANLRNVYVYWRMACTAQWMKYASVADRLRELPDIKRYFNEIVDDQLEIRSEIGLDPRYYGGGIYRALGGIYSNSLASMMRDDLPNGAKALVMIDRALRSTPYPGDVNGGDAYYMNYRHKAEVMKFNGDQQGARTLLESIIAEIDELIAAGELPQGLEGETKGEQMLMRAMVGG